MHEAQEPSDYVQELAGSLHEDPRQDVLRGEFVHARFDRAASEAVVRAPTPARARIDFFSPEVARRTDLAKAPWFGTAYACEPVPQEWLDRFARYDAQPARIHPALHLPERNPFVPAEFGLRTHESQQDAQAQARNGGPVLLVLPSRRASVPAGRGVPLDPVPQCTCCSSRRTRTPPPDRWHSRSCCSRPGVDSVNDVDERASLSWSSAQRRCAQAWNSSAPASRARWRPSCAHCCVGSPSWMPGSVVSRVPSGGDSNGEKTARHFQHLYLAYC